jgi:hypothetical protein
MTVVFTMARQMVTPGLHPDLPATTAASPAARSVTKGYLSNSLALSYSGYWLSRLVEIEAFDCVKRLRERELRVIRAQ